jgi:hypothetical protein
MPRGLLPRSRLLTGWACGLIALGVAGCTTTTPAVTVSGKALTVYVSAPGNLASDPQAQAAIAGEKLAFNQLKGQVKGFTLNLRVLGANRISDNARTAIEDQTAVAYLGEALAGLSVKSIGITNAQDLLQVSPAPGASVPSKDFESFSTYGRTFASLAPTSAQQAQAIIGGSAGRSLGRSFQSTYNQAPSAQAILGYTAMAAALKALQRAGSAANNRGTVRDDFFALKNVQLTAGPNGPVLGTYTVNPAGTVTLTPAS